MNKNNKDARSPPSIGNFKQYNFSLKIGFDDPPFFYVVMSLDNTYSVQSTFIGRNYSVFACCLYQNDT